jgi:hypothetical protein
MWGGSDQSRLTAPRRISDEPEIHDLFEQNLSRTRKTPRDLGTAQSRQRTPGWRSPQCGQAGSDQPGLRATKASASALADAGPKAADVPITTFRCW